MCEACGCDKKHPVDVLKRKKIRLSRVHALEIARRAMKAGENNMMPLTANEMPSPVQDAQTADPTAAWPGMVGQGPTLPGEGM